MWISFCIFNQLIKQQINSLWSWLVCPIRCPQLIGSLWLLFL